MTVPQNSFVGMIHLRKLQYFLPFGIALFACMQGCKLNETSPSPAPKATDRPYSSTPATTQPATGTNPTGTSNCDPVLYVCYPDAKIVEECKKTETDVSRCNQILKTTYEQLQAKIGQTPTDATCTDLYAVTVDVGGYLNVRSSGNLDSLSNVIGKLNRGDKVCAVGVEGEWQKIRYNNAPAFAAAKLLSPNKPNPLVTAANGSGVTTSPPPSTNKTLPDGGLNTCPTASGYFAAKVQNSFHWTPDYYATPDAHLLKSGVMIAGQFLCASTVTKNVTRGWEALFATYAMVKVKVPNKSGEFWMECKFLASDYAAKARCP